MSILKQAILKKISKTGSATLLEIKMHCESIALEEEVRNEVLEMVKNAELSRHATAGAKKDYYYKIIEKSPELIAAREPEPEVKPQPKPKKEKIIVTATAKKDETYIEKTVKNELEIILRKQEKKRHYAMTIVENTDAVIEKIKQQLTLMGG